VPVPHTVKTVCPRNLLKVRVRCLPVNPLCPQDFHPFCTTRGAQPPGKSFTKGALGTRQNATSAHQGPCFGTSSETYFGNPAEAEVSKLGKRSCGGSCENAKTLRGSLSPNDNPVAGANFRGYLVSVDLMPDKRREIQQKRPASHILLSTFVFYTISARRAQGGVY
jgi:hypothetical protein